MTIQWVKTDPLVMNGEPFCYGSRLTVRQLLELRRAGYSVGDLVKDHPELEPMGIAEAYAFAAANRERYADFFTEEYLERRRQAMARYTGWKGVDDLDPKCPAGHARGVRTSVRLTRTIAYSPKAMAAGITRAQR